jgi:hypothetical protein
LKIFEKVAIDAQASPLPLRGKNQLGFIRAGLFFPKNSIKKANMIEANSPTTPAIITFCLLLGPMGNSGGVAGTETWMVAALIAEEIFVSSPFLERISKVLLAVSVFLINLV